jgi:hypothetical protein
VSVRVERLRARKVAGIAALIAILVLPIILLVLPFEIGFAVPEIIEALIVAAWTIFMGAKLLKYEHQARAPLRDNFLSLNGEATGESDNFYLRGWIWLQINLF